MGWIEELDRLLGDAGVTFKVGLRQQGHLEAVRELRRQAVPWELIGEKIGWTAKAASEWYEFELEAERDAARAELRRLRERVELMANHHERQETAYVAVQPRSEHRAIGKAFRELLAEHDAEKAEEEGK